MRTRHVKVLSLNGFSGRGGTVVKGRRRLMALVFALACVLLVNLSAPANAAWSTSWQVSASGWDPSNPRDMAVDRQGDAIFVWMADNRQTLGSDQVQMRMKPASGSAGSIKTLSALGPLSTAPQAASDDDGDSAVVWRQEGRIVGRRVSASGEVGPIRLISSLIPNAVADNPVVVVSPSGVALVVWTEFRIEERVVLARHFYPDGLVGPVLALGEGSEMPAADISRTGTAVVAWTDNQSRVLARRISPGYVSSAQVLIAPISSVGGFGWVHVGVDQDGDAVISFASNGEEQPGLWISRWSRSGSLSAPFVASAPTDRLGMFHALATDLEGDSMLVWTRGNSSNQLEMVGRMVNRDGALGAITRLGLYDHPQLALDDDGDGLVTFDIPGSTDQVGTRTISRTGSFGSTKTLSGRFHQVDIGPTGRATVMWMSGTYPDVAYRAISGP
ncbi:hypothetical protein [Actinopolymorpha alba]|uniref:hypothetical protein n=1 Tax=Actinopolymorpha alba TaxID=533267 RepID=UPI00038129A7|nr:hypothetical protein [Actinopolymorpha alba]